MMVRALRSPTLARWALIVYWVLMFVSTHMPGVERFAPPGGWPWWFDKSVHALIYSGWTVAWWWALRAHGRRLAGVTLAWFLAGTAGYALFDELTQPLVGRSADVRDFAADLLAAVAALIAMRWFDHRGWPAGDRWKRGRAAA
jgi:VanZ family protein